MYRDSVAPYDRPALLAYMETTIAKQITRGQRFASAPALQSLFPYADPNLFQSCVTELTGADILRKDWYFDEDRNKVTYYEFMGARTPENTEPPF